MAIDLTREEAPRRLAEAVVAQFGSRLDVLVNNAGIEGRALIETFNAAE